MTLKTAPVIQIVDNGNNFATEPIAMPWQHLAMDRINPYDIHKAHVDQKIQGYRTSSALDFFLLTTLVRRIKFYKPSKLMPYDKEDAITFLESKGWRKYPYKHGNTIFTRIFQDYILPTKSGIDKRRTRLTSLIHGGSMSRYCALAIFQEQVFNKIKIRREIELFCQKIVVSIEEFDQLMGDALLSHKDYANWDHYIKILQPLKNSIFRLRG